MDKTAQEQAIEKARAGAFLRQYETADKDLYERFAFRDIRPEEAEQTAEIERVCFPPNEACSRKMMLERVAKAPEMFLVAVDRATGRIYRICGRAECAGKWQQGTCRIVNKILDFSACTGLQCYSIKSREGVGAAHSREECGWWRRSRGRLSFRERGSSAVSPFKFRSVLNFRTGAALRGAQAEEDRIRDSDMICSAVTRSAVARVKRIKSLIKIRNQGGTADIIRPFRLKSREGLFLL